MQFWQSVAIMFSPWKGPVWAESTRKICFRIFINKGWKRTLGSWTKTLHVNMSLRHLYTWDRWQHFSILALFSSSPPSLLWREYMLCKQFHVSLMTLLALTKIVPQKSLLMAGHKTEGKWTHGTNREKYWLRTRQRKNDDLENWPGWKQRRAHYQSPPGQTHTFCNFVLFWNLTCFYGSIKTYG